MHSIVMDHAGEPEVMEYRETPLPEPGPGQIRIKVAAVGVNFIETYQRDGTYDVPTPFTPGAECAGYVDALGEGVTGLQDGDLVATSQARGTYAEYAIADADKVYKVPAGIDPKIAAAAPLQAYTAHYLTTDVYPVTQGTVALTTAGAGGVGQLLTQMIKRKGGTVVTTTSTPEKAEIARSAGADHVLRYDEVPEKVMELTDGRGVDVVYDGVGKATFDANLDALRPRGLYVLFGGASGQVPPFDLQRLNQHGSLYITRPSLATYMASPEDRERRAREVFEAIQDGDLKIDIGRTYGLSEAPEAHRALQSRGTRGKILLLP